jgi:hypothetical protein
VGEPLPEWGELFSEKTARQKTKARVLFRQWHFSGVSLETFPRLLFVDDLRNQAIALIDPPMSEIAMFQQLTPVRDAWDTI